jgi:secondary thiamine-phosphate synthase enzyme
MKELNVKTGRHAEFIDITDRLQDAVGELGVRDGACTVFVPHTTAGVTINENADPSVVDDMIYALDKAIPWNSPHYRHSEGNTAAHVKSSLVGHSVQLLIRGGRLQLGTWQGVYFCEFDGPRSRKVWLTVTAEAAG